MGKISHYDMNNIIELNQLLTLKQFTIPEDIKY